MNTKDKKFVTHFLRKYENKLKELRTEMVINTDVIKDTRDYEQLLCMIIADIDTIVKTSEILKD